ncbi:unnamed protein product [Ambrosiozyma monospora]|uniref:Unnamed protein product n=1 Tax=Ambrosiozyma monospora TaxID=43982 RepID=A0A9W7DFE1_AMBMO|nr:unnamed protein product [Ambrosiozyma monospora]
MSSKQIANLLASQTPTPENRKVATHMKKVANVNKQSDAWISPFRPTGQPTTNVPTAGGVPIEAPITGPTPGATTQGPSATQRKASAVVSAAKSNVLGSVKSMKKGFKKVSSSTGKTNSKSPAGVAEDSVNDDESTQSEAQENIIPNSAGSIDGANAGSLIQNDEVTADTTASLVDHAGVIHSNATESGSKYELESALDHTASGNGSLHEDEEVLDPVAEKPDFVSSVPLTKIDSGYVSATEPEYKSDIEPTGKKATPVVDTNSVEAANAAPIDVTILENDSGITAGDADIAESEPKVSEYDAEENEVLDEEPVDLTPVKTDEIEEQYADKPKLLNRYIENKHLVSSAMNKSEVENPHRVIDLGAGLKLTEAQIYALARKRVAPILKSVDHSVQQSRVLDQEKADAEELRIKDKDEGKMAKQLAKFKEKVDKENAAITNDHETKMKETENKMAYSAKVCEKYISDVKTKIIQDAEDAITAKENAIAAHGLHKQHTIDESEAFREKSILDLQTAIDSQPEQKEKAAEFKAKGDEYKIKADELEAKLNEKKQLLLEKMQKLEALLNEKSEKRTLTRSAIKQKKASERNLLIATHKHERAAANVKKLNGHVALLDTHIGAHSTKIEHLNTAGQDELIAKRDAAKQANETWQAELVEMRTDEAKKQYRKTIEADEERKRIAREKADEEQRIEKEKVEAEKKARMARIAEEKRQLAETEEKIRQAELRKNQHEQEAKRLEEEVAEMEKLKELRFERDRLANELFVAEAEEQARIAKIDEEKKLLALKEEEIKQAELIRQKHLLEKQLLEEDQAGIKKLEKLRAERDKLARELDLSTVAVSSFAYPITSDEVTPITGPGTAGTTTIHEHPDEVSIGAAGNTSFKSLKPVQSRKSVVDEAAEKVLPSGNRLTRSGSLSKVSSFAKKFTPRSRSNSKTTSSHSTSTNKGVKSIKQDVEPKTSNGVVSPGTGSAVTFHSAKRSKGFTEWNCIE